MEQTELNKILARVKKMMTLADNAAATEGERDNALRMAHATLAKFNLDMSQVDAVSHDKQDPRNKDALVMTDAAPWVRSLASAVADLFFCSFFFTQRWDHNLHSKTHMYFVGRQSNIVTAMEMTSYLVKSIMKEAAATAKANGQGSKFKTSFCKGASATIYWRCKDIRNQAEAVKNTAASSSTALVLVDVYAAEKKANEVMIAETVGKLESKKSGAHRAGAGYYEGVEFGKTVSLNKQVNGTSTTNNPKLK
jgi:hypothetical protein